MWIVALALRRPYTFIVMSLLIAILGCVSIFRMPTDIFPFINIPVVSVIWSYNGLPAEEMENRICTICERAMTTVTSDIDHIESSSLNGVCVIKVYLHNGADVGRAVGTIASLCQTLLKIYPPGITPPLITSFSASDVPILQMGVSSESLSESELFDYGLNFIRTGLSGVEGAQIPLPYGGKMRQVMVDLDPQALQAKHLSAADVSNALIAQNVIIPSGSAKIGETEYAVQLNSSPLMIDAFNNIPIKTVNGATIYMRDVANVHDGYAVQTNIVHQNGRRSTLLNVLKTGSASTISVVQRVKEALPRVMSTVPKELKLTLLADQSRFVKAAVEGVAREAATAAFLTALLILLLLGSWRSTFIVAISIPLSILASICGLYACGQTINTMTLGGLALAVGMLVDDATVEIENIHRNFHLGKTLTQAILDGAQQIAAPAFVSTLSICIVFIPVALLTEPARSLFVPLGMAVVFAMLTSYLLSRTLVPVMAQWLLGAEHPDNAGTRVPGRGFWGVFTLIHKFIDDCFERLRRSYKYLIHYLVARRAICVCVFLAFYSASFLLLPFVGQDFFPLVDAGQIRIHLTARTGTRLEETERVFARIEREVRKIIPASDIEAILDNIGLPTSGINLSYGDNMTMSAFDGEMLISLDPEHKGSTFAYMKSIRKMLHEKFPEVKYFFQPADIVSQILNAGLPAPIDVQVTGRDKKTNYKLAEKLKDRISQIKGAVDVTLHQVVDNPQLRFDVDRTRANQLGYTQRDIASSLLINLSSSFQTGPNYWVNPKNGVNYIVAVQTPTYRINTIDDILNTSLTSQTAKTPQLFANVASLKRSTTSAIISHYKIQPVFDVFANVQDRDLGSVSNDVNAILKEMEHELPRGSYFVSRGQANNMNSAFTGLLAGTLFALVLVYLLLVVNFHSWIDPCIILMAIPGAFSGIIIALFATDTAFSVPALMGAIMSIGVASANSILVVSFANEKLEQGASAADAAVSAGYTRFRPVIMTAAAMIIGMLPMALGLGEGGSQNAPLGRAVIGGLIVATFATLYFVPCVFASIRGRIARKTHVDPELATTAVGAT